MWRLLKRYLKALTAIPGVKYLLGGQLKQYLVNLFGPEKSTNEDIGRYGELDFTWNHKLSMLSYLTS